MVTYTITEAASVLKVGHKVVRKLIADGTLRAFKVGKQWRISEDAIRALDGAAQS